MVSSLPTPLHAWRGELRVDRRTLLLGAVGLSLAPACGSEPKPAPAAPPEARVVSTSPSMTEIVFALGKGSSLVGRSRFCDYPPEVKSVPEVGGFSDPSVELILSLRPTLVCGERGPAGPELPRALEARGIATFFPEMDGVASIGSAMAELGKRLGIPDDGQRLVRELEGSIDEVERGVAGKPHPRTLFLFDWKPLVVAGPGSFPDELLILAGAKNVVGEGGKYPRIGLETLFSSDPDVIIDGSGHGDERPAPQREIPALETLRAAREGRIHALASTAALRPGPRLGAGLAELARLIHGGIG